MSKTIIVLGLIALLLIGGAFYMGFDSKPEPTNTGLYQGPVPEGYDKQHFRLTGETQPLKEGIRE